MLSLIAKATQPFAAAEKELRQAAMKATPLLLNLPPMPTTTLITQQLAKRFNRDWLFKEVEIQLETGQALAVTGANGSGKSTLLQVLAGVLPPTRGEVLWTHQGKALTSETLFRHLTIAAPYMELPEEMTAAELYHFQAKFKAFMPGMEQAAFLDAVNLAHCPKRPINQYSSGMKQRLKLGLAAFAASPILLLDEPTANMDATHTQWYQQLLPSLLPHKLVVVCSNQPSEYEFATHHLNLGAL